VEEYKIINKIYYFSSFIYYNIIFYISYSKKINMRTCLYGVCENCYEEISNPICIRCFTKQINHWLKESPLTLQERKKILLEIKNHLDRSMKDIPENQSKCSICGRDDVSLCSYCIFLKINDLIKKLKINNELKTNFLQIFNYRHWYEDN
jgi:hypothetical protein